MSLKALLGRRYGELGVSLLVLGVGLVHVLWVLEDQTPMPVNDSYSYMNRLLSFLGIFEAEGAGSAMKSIGRLSHMGRPPLYQLITLPFLGNARSEDAFLMANLVFLAIIIVSTYQIGTLAGNKVVGLLAALLAVTYPPVATLSRQYLPHFTVTSCVALTTWFLILCLQNRAIRNAWLLSGSLAAGALLHPNFIMTIVLPAGGAYAYMILIRRDPDLPKGTGSLARLRAKLMDPFVYAGLLPGLVVAAIPVMAWYLGPGFALLETLRALMSPELASFRGFDKTTIGFAGVPPTFWWYARTAPGAMSNVLSVFALVGFFVALKTRRAAGRALALLLAGTFVAISLQANLAWWSGAALLPASAVLTALWISKVRPVWLTCSLAGICCAVAIFNFSLVTWGERPWSRPVAQTLGAPLGSATCASPARLGFCPHPPDRAPWPIKAVLDTVLEDPTCSDRACQVLIVSHRIIKSSIFNFELLRRPAPPRARFLSSGTPRMGAPYRLDALLGSDYLFYTVPRRKPAATTRIHYEAATLMYLWSPPPAFSRSHMLIAEYVLPTDEIARLVKRTRPLSVEEVEQSVEALELPERFKVGKHALLADLYAADERVEEALEHFRSALTHARDDRTRARNYLRMGHLKLQQDDSAAAIRLLQSAVELDPSNARARRLLTVAEKRAGKG